MDDMQLDGFGHLLAVGRTQLANGSGYVLQRLSLTNQVDWIVERTAPLFNGFYPAALDVDPDGSVVGLVAADGGEVALDRNELTHLPIHRRARLGLSYLPQEASVFRKLTVAENILAVLELQRLRGDALNARLESLLEQASAARVGSSPARVSFQSMSAGGTVMPARWANAGSPRLAIISAVSALSG